jgi:hypothetical protein
MERLVAFNQLNGGTSRPHQGLPANFFNQPSQQSIPLNHFDSPAQHSQQSFSLNHFNSPAQPPQQTSFHASSTPPPQQSQPDMAAPHSYEPSPYQPPAQSPQQMAHSFSPPQAPSEPLEQRVFELLSPYRDECFVPDDSANMAANLTQGRLAQVLSGRLNFAATLLISMRQICPGLPVLC